jgi:hypothetical protein
VSEQSTCDNRYDIDMCISVIAISGLGGHAFGSFKERGGPFMWLRDALPFDVPGARILVYGYDTQLIRSSSFQNLTDLGRNLQSDMKGIRVSRFIFFLFELFHLANLVSRKSTNLVP